MAKPKKEPSPKIEDEAQRQKFLDLAHELEAAGELSPTADGSAMDDLLRLVESSPRE